MLLFYTHKENFIFHTSLHNMWDDTPVYARAGDTHDTDDTHSDPDSPRWSKSSKTDTQFEDCSKITVQQPNEPIQWVIHERDIALVIQLVDGDSI